MPVAHRLIGSMARTPTTGGTKARNQTRSSAAETTFLHRFESGIWGLGIVILGLLLLVALGGTNPEDYAREVTTNPIGPLGMWMSYIFFSLVGWMSVPLTLSLLFFGGTLVARKALRLTWRNVLGVGILTLALCVFLDLLQPKVVDGWPPLGGGGVFGWSIHTVLHALVHTVGTVILAAGALIAGLCVLLRIHPVSLFRVPAGWIARLWTAVTSGSGNKDDEDELEDEGDELAQGPATLDSDEGTRRAVPITRSTAGQEAPLPTAELLADDDPEATAAGGKRRGTTTGRALPVAQLETDDGAQQANTGSSASQGSVPIHMPTAPVADLGDVESGDPAPSSPGALNISVNRPPAKEYELPDLSLLEYHPPVRQAVDDESLQSMARLVVEKLQDFRVDGEVTGINPGPVITLFEFRPGRGVKVAQVANLSKDLAMAVAAEQVRVIAPIPGRDVVGIEIPNRIRETVYLRTLLQDRRYKEGNHKLPLALGKDIAGFPVIADLTKMPHLLVAGTTGSGKSVALHAFIMSILYRLSPQQVKFLFVDPKMLEFTSYADIPHLLLPVVTEARDAIVALRWAVGEMERRNRTMSAFSVPNITEYNDVIHAVQENPALLEPLMHSASGPAAERLREIVDSGEFEPFPYIIVVIDELADLMMVAGKQVETSVARLAQMARAAGIHMIIATQNPTIKVVTGVIKANMPARLSFKVRTMQDSRVILDQNGADDLLGWGDMLFLPPGSSKIQRIHGAFVSTEERLRVVEHLKEQGAPEYNLAIMESFGDDEEGESDDPSSGSDDLYRQARTIAIRRGKISTSALQRELGIGYNKAAVLMSKMEKEGLVGPQEAAGKPRVVLARQ